VPVRPVVAQALTAAAVGAGAGVGVGVGAGLLLAGSRGSGQCGQAARQAPASHRGPHCPKPYGYE
jgi:hypothetical protein